MSITLLLILRTILNRDDKSEVKEAEYNKGKSMNSILNGVLLFISRVENKISLSPPQYFWRELVDYCREKMKIAFNKSPLTGNEQKHVLGSINNFSISGDGQFINQILI